MIIGNTGGDIATASTSIIAITSFVINVTATTTIWCYCYDNDNDGYLHHSLYAYCSHMAVVVIYSLKIFHHYYYVC